MHGGDLVLDQFGAVARAAMQLTVIAVRPGNVASKTALIAVVLWL